MAVTIARGTISRMRESRGAVLLRVEGAADPRAAARGLEQAMGDVGDLEPAYISEVMRTPEGPMVFIDDMGIPAANLRDVPEIIARHLVAAGVTDAVVAFPDMCHTLGALGRLANGVALHLFVAPPRMVSVPGAYPMEWVSTELPPAWLDEVAGWVTAGRAPTDELWVRLGVAEFTVAAADVRQLVGDSDVLVVAAKAPGPRRTTREMMRTAYREEEVEARLGGRVRGVHVVPRSHLVVAAGGPDASDEDLLGAYEDLRAMARRLAADVTYGYILTSRRLAVLAATGVGGPWSDEGGPSLGGIYSYVRDELVFDGFPYQILSAGHLARCAELPPGAVPLVGGRVEISIGDPAAWLPDLPAEPDPAHRERYRDPQIPQRARQVMAPWLVTEDELVRLRRARYGF